MIKKASLLTACSVTAFSAWAQDTSPDTLVVTANRFEQPRSTVLAPTTVVTRQDIDRWQSTSVNDVLRRLPGVDITPKRRFRSALIYFYSRYKCQSCVGVN